MFVKNRVYFLALMLSLFSSFAAAWSDTDNDGVPDLKDACPHTLANVEVWADGCAKDKPSGKNAIAEAICLKRLSGGQYPDNCSPLTPLTIYFDLGKVDMGFDQVANLNRLVSFLKHNSVRICILGHSDKSGSEQLNQQISLARAQNIKQLLVEDYGLAEERFSLRAMGSSQPSQDKQSPSERRVEFVVE